MYLINNKKKIGEKTISNFIFSCPVQYIQICTVSHCTVLLKIDYTTEQLFLLSIKTDLKHKNRFPLNHLNVIFIQLLNISHILAIF